MNEPENALFPDWVSNISEGNKLNENEPKPQVPQYMAQSNLYSYGNTHEDYIHRAFGFSNEKQKTLFIYISKSYLMKFRNRKKYPFNKVI